MSERLGRKLGRLFADRNMSRLLGFSLVVHSLFSFDTTLRPSDGCDRLFRVARDSEYSRGLGPPRSVRISRAIFFCANFRKSDFLVNYQRR